jgi:hypothetical protein
MKILNEGSGERNNDTRTSSGTASLGGRCDALRSGRHRNRHTRRTTCNYYGLVIDVRRGGSIRQRWGLKIFERFKFRGGIEGVLYMYEFKGGNMVQSFRVYFRVNGSNGAS